MTLKEEREAIFAQHPDCDRKTLEKQLRDSLPKLAKLYKVPNQGKPMRVGNEILKQYFANQKKVANVEAAIQKRFDDNKHYFQEIFVNRLLYYWNRFTGFDVLKFDEFIKPLPDQTLSDAVKARYGDEAVALIHRLLGK